MRKVALSLLMMSALILSSMPASQAGLNAQINLDNPRAVPIFGQGGPSEVSSMAGWSGFLYSPRIVFSAAHSHYRFDSNGDRILVEPAYITVGKPNSSTKDGEGRAKVIKTFVGDYKKSSTGWTLNDFIVLVLDRDLADVAPAKLMTAAIEAELVKARTEVIFHGYGEYRDRCDPGQKNPCPEDRNNPNKSPSELPRIMKSNLAPKSDFTWLQGQGLTELANETLLTNLSLCPGDSGSGMTATYKGDVIYVGQGISTGMNFYACGATNAPANEKHPREMGFISPVFKHLNLIKQAEDFIAQQSGSKKSATSKPAAVAKAGAKCSKAGSTEVVQGKKYTCVKSGKKLAWNKGVKVVTIDTQSIQSAAYANMKKAMVPKPAGNLFRYHYSPNALEGYKEKIEKELNFSMGYWTSVYDGTELFNIFYATEKDLDWLINAWKMYDLDKNGYTEREYRGRLEREGSQLNAGSVPSQEGQSHLSFFRSSTRPIQDDAMIPHENVHIVQQQLTKSRTDQMPCWLREGSANLFGNFLITEKFGLGVYEDVKRSDMNSYQSGSVEIRNFSDSQWFTHLKSLEGNFSGGCDYKNRFAYGTGLLLSEVLMAEGGFEKMMEFWRAFSLELDWRQSFKNIYGVEIDIWYKTRAIPYLMQEYSRVKRY